MLEKEEIIRISKIKGLSMKNTEKDYLLELLLYILYKEVGRKLIFKGGTALYKLHSLNRFSQDLDFTLDSSKIKIEVLFKKIISRLKDIGVNGRIKELSDYRNQKNIKLELKGPLFDGNVKNLTLIIVNISLKEKCIYKPEQRKIFSQYPDIATFDVFVMPLDELFAEKIRTVMTRDKARDIYDIWFLLNKKAKFDLKLINKKLKLYKKTFNKKEFKIEIEEKRKNWNRDLDGIIIGNLPDFLDVKREIERMMGI